MEINNSIAAIVPQHGGSSIEIHSMKSRTNCFIDCVLKEEGGSGQCIRDAERANPANRAVGIDDHRRGIATPRRYENIVIA